MKLPDRSTITPEFLKENDGKLVWTRDDYLSMNGIQGEDELYHFLNHVIRVKQAARAAGMEFSA